MGAGGKEEEGGSLQSSHSSLASGKAWFLHSPLWKVEKNAEINQEELMPKGSESQAVLPKAGKLMPGRSHLIWPESGVMDWPEDLGQPGQRRGLLGSVEFFPRQRLPCPPHPQARGGNHIQLGLFYF